MANIAPVQAATGINKTLNFQGRLLTASGAVVADGNYNMRFKVYQDGPGNVAGDTGGTLMWTELWQNSVATGSSTGVVVKNGYFSVNLGTYCAFAGGSCQGASNTGIDFNQDTLWLSMDVAGTAVSNTPTYDGELLPMRRLASSVYALQAQNSNTLNGLASSQFVQLAQGVQTDTSTANASIFINKTGTTANIMDLQRGGADVMVINNAGQALFRPQTDSTTALSVQKAGTTTTIFTVDTTNQRVGINTASPGENLTVNGNFSVRDADTASKGYRFRTSGSALDFEGGGADLYISNWTGADFTGTQRNYLLLQSGASIAQAISSWQWKTAASGTTRHTLDGTVGADVLFNQDGEATNFSVQGDTDANLLYAKGSTDRVGIGTNAPGYKLDVVGSINASTSVLAPVLDTASAGGLSIGGTNATSINIGKTASNITTTINGQAVIKPTSGNDSSAAFQIQNALGLSLLNVNTTADPTNLIANGSFETNTTGWAAKGGASISSTSAQGLFGSKSLGVTTTATADDGVKFPVSLTAGVTYSFSFFDRLASGSFSTLALGYSADGSTETTYVDSGNTSSTSGWTRHVITFTPAAVSGSPYLFIKQTSSTARTFYIDGAYLIAGSATGAFKQSTLSFDGAITSPVVIQSASDTQSALWVIDNAGNTVVSVDTRNARLGVGTTAAAAKLHVTTGASVTVIKGNTTSNGDLINLSNNDVNVFSVTSTGVSLFKNTTNSLTAFQIQPSGSTTPVFNVDTTNSRVGIGKSTPNYALDVTGTASASISVLAPLFDTASAAALNIGTTNATSINLNQNTILGAGKSLTLAGGNTASRPGSPSEGALYYDTDAKSLLVFANGKWQADRSTATKIVGTSASGGASSAVASQKPDGADFVNTSTTSAQTVINSAISALPASGGTVYLMEGTYIVDGSINLPSNVRLTGAGDATIIKAKNGIGTNAALLTNADATFGNDNIVIDTLQLDGNRANNSSISINGLFLTSTNNPAGDISNVKVQDAAFVNFKAEAIYAFVTDAIFSNNRFSNSDYGISVQSGARVKILNNIIDVKEEGILLYEAANSLIQGNTLYQSGAGLGLGIDLGDAIDGTVVTGNNIENVHSIGISAWRSSNTTISNNILRNGGGSGSDSAIDVQSTTSNVSITGNKITDTAGSGYAISLAASVSGTYLSNNTFSGTGASSISDLGTGTIYANQHDSSGNLMTKAPGGTLVVGATANTAFQIQNAAGTADLTVDSSTGTLTVNQGGLAVNGLSNPATPTLASTGTTGTLAAATYTYRLSATSGAGETQAIATSPTSVTTTGSTSKNTISWSAVTYATGYKLYRSTDGGTTWFVNTLGAVTSAVDNGSNFTWSTSGTPNLNANNTAFLNLTNGATIRLDTAGYGNLKSTVGSSYTTILGNYGSGGIIKLQSDSFQVQDTTGYNANLAISNTGATTFKNRVNSATAFQIQNSAGISFFTANSENSVITTKDLNVGNAANESGAARLFSDDYESGDLSKWSSGSNGTISTAQVNNGKYSTLIAPSASAISDYAMFTPVTTAVARGYFRINSGTSDSILSLGYLSPSSYVTLGINGSSQLVLTNSVTGITTTSATTMSNNVWHRLELKATASNGSGVMQVYLDGSLVNDLNLSSLNTGTNGYNYVQIGTGAIRTVNFNADDIAVDTVLTGDSANLYVGDTLHVSGTSSFGGISYFANDVNASARLLTSAVDTASAGILNIGTTNATDIYLGSTTSETLNQGDLTVSGTLRTASDTSVERGFSATFPDATNNQKIDLYFPEYWGELEVSVTAASLNADATGNITKKFALGLSPGNSIYDNTSRYSEALGLTPDHFAISDVSWDAANSRYRIQIVHRTNSLNGVAINVKGHPYSAGYANVIQTQMGLSSVYTTDTTAYAKPAVSFQGDVGIGGKVTAGTSVLAPVFDTASAGALTLGNTNATSIAIGKTGSNIATTVTGTAVIKPSAGNDSAAAFQIQNASAQSLFNIDTTVDATNLIANGSFEAGTSGWAAKGSATLSQASSPSLYGAKSLSIANTATAQDGVKYPVTLTAGTTYSFTFYARLASGSFSTLAFGYSADGTTESTYLNSNNTVNITGWNRYTMTFTPAAVSGSPYIFIKQTTATARTFYVDGTYLTVGSSGGNYAQSKLTFDGAVTSPLVLQNASDSQTGLLVQDSAGASILAVDTYNGRVGVGTTAPAAKLSVSTSGTTPGLKLLTTGTGNLLDLYNGSSSMGSISATGAVLFKNSSNSNAAFQVQNASGQTLFNIDTTPDTTNLITNGSVESDTSGWSGKAGATVSQASSPSLYGSKSLSVATTATANDGVKYPVTLTAGTAYNLTFYARIASGTFTNMSFGYSADGSTEATYVNTNNTVNSSGWNRYSMSFTPSAVSGTPYIFIKQASGTARTIYVDGAYLVASSSAGNFSQSKLSFDGVITSPLILQSASDSQAALLVQDSSGNSVLAVDTYNGRLGVGTTSPAAKLAVSTSGSTPGIKVLTTGSGNLLDLYNGTTSVGSISSTGAALFLNSIDSTAALQVQKANAEAVLTVDTTNNRVKVGDNAAGGYQAITFVGQATNNAASVSSLAVTRTTTAGNLLVMTIGTNSTSNGPTSVTDTAGNAWQLAGSISGTSGTGSRTDIYYVANAASITSATVNNSSALDTTANLSEYSGAALTNVLDTAVTNVNANTTNHTTTAAGTSIDGELLIGNMSYIGSLTTSGPGGGWTSLTNVDNVSNQKHLRAAYQVSGTAGSYTATWTTNGATTSGAILAAFKPAPTTSSTASLFVVDSATTAAAPGGTNGGIYYDTSLNKFRCFEGGVYVNCIGATGAILQAPTSTAVNTITPTTNSVVALTVNGTSGTAAAALNVVQSGAASNITVSNTGATSQSLVSLSQSAAAYTGTALLFNMANGSGSFSSGNFLDFQTNGSSKFKVDYTGLETNNGVSIVGTNGSLNMYSWTDGGEYNIGSSGTGTLAFFGSAGSTLDINLLDGNLKVGGTTVLTAARGLQNITSASIVGNSASALVVQNGSNVSQLTVDTSSSKISVGTIGGDTTGTILVLGNKTTSGDPTGVDGAVYYNSNYKRMRCYVDGQWRFCNDPVGLTWGIDMRDDFLAHNYNSAGMGGDFNWAEDTNGGAGTSIIGVAPDLSYRPGQLQLSTGTTSTGRENIYADSGNLNGYVNPYFIGGGEEIEFAINIPTLANTTDDYVMRFGLCDNNPNAGADCLNGVYFEYNRATSVNWIYATAKASTRTKTTSGTAVAAGWNRFKITVNSAGTSIDFAVNGTSLGTATTTNIPNTTSNLTEPSMTIIKTAGTSSRSFKIDYFQYRKSLTSPR